MKKIILRKKSIQKLSLLLIGVFLSPFISSISVKADTLPTPQLGEVIKTVNVNEQVKAIDGNNGWWLISERGKLAWCNAGPTSYWDDKKTGYPQLLKIKSQMEIYEAQALCNYTKGQVINKIGSSVGGWIKVKTAEGYTGWVNESLTSQNSNGTIIASSDLNVYFTADIAPLDRVKEVKIGEQVKAIDGRNGYWLIAESGKLGWINAGPTSYWNGEKTGYPQLLRIDKNQIMYEAGIVYSYTRGEKLDVVEGSLGGWWRVKTPNGYNAWVNAGPTYKDENGYIYARETLSAYFTGREPSITQTAQEKIINEAMKHLGKPYVWGATGPSSFDCSGFTQYVYKQALGIDITRTTYTQINSGREVSRSELQPGDLVFPSSGHVQIYIGNGMVIHSPKPGDVVKIVSIYDFWRARRIIN